MCKDTTPFRLYSHAELGILHNFFEKEIKNWLLEWGLISAPIIELRPVNDDLLFSDQSTWLVIDENGPAIKDALSLTKMLNNLAFKGEKDSLSSSMVNHQFCNAILLDMFDALFHQEVTSKRDNLFQRREKLSIQQKSMASLLLTFSFLEEQVAIVIPYHCIKHHLPQPRKLSLSPLSLVKIPNKSKIILEIHTLSTRIHLEEILNANKGDVIKLDHKISDPLQILLEGNEKIGECEFGTYKKNLAVKIIM